MYQFPFFIKRHLTKEYLLPHQRKHSAGINVVKFFPSGQRIITGGSDDSIRIFNLAGEELFFFEGHLAPITDLAIHSSGKIVASVSEDKTLRLWDLESQKQLACFIEADDSLNAVLFSKDGTKVLSGGRDKKLRIYDIQNKILLSEIDLYSINSMVNHPKENFLILGTNSKIIIVDLTLGIKFKEFSAHQLPILQLDISPKSPHGKYFLISCSIDEYVKLWDIDTYQEIFNFKPHSGAVTCVRFSPKVESNLFATGSYDRSIGLFQSGNTQAVKRYRGPKFSVKSLDWSPDGHLLVFVSSDGSIRIVDNEKEEEILNLEKNELVITSLLSNLEKDELLLGTESGNLRKISFNTNISEPIVKMHESEITKMERIEIIPGKSIIITSGIDKVLKIWDPESWSLLAIAKGHKGGIRDFSISPDKKFILSCSNDTTVKKFDLTNLVSLLATLQNPKESSEKIDHLESQFPIEIEESLTLNHHRHSVNAISFTNNERYLATVSNDHNIVLLDTETLSPKLVIKGHKDHVLCLMFSPDDKKLYTGSRNGDIIIYETFSGKIINQLNFHSDAVQALLSNQGKFFISISDDNSSILFSEIDSVSGQAFFSSNLRSIVFNNEFTKYYISTDLGEIIQVDLSQDELTYQLDNPSAVAENLLDELNNEANDIKEFMKNNTKLTNEIIYWALKRKNWLQQFSIKFDFIGKDLPITSVIEQIIQQFPEEQVNLIQSNMKN
ncbi:MAG: WD40 repeat domain-containing protein [Candidatus Thorarchaeota archaeon]